MPVRGLLDVEAPGKTRNYVGLVKPVALRVNAVRHCRCCALPIRVSCYVAFCGEYRRERMLHHWFLLVQLTQKVMQILPMAYAMLSKRRGSTRKYGAPS